ncbi:MAG: 3-oxoacyl-[acyl-carrier-protein] synthase III C-terminal domain-containing protein [Pseudomonadota bacterium]
MAAEFGILSIGAYVPSNRIPRASIFDAVGWAQSGLKGLAKGERAYGSWDEDAITMAVEAARSALADRQDLTPDAICFASTTAPFLDRQNAGVVAAALDAPREISAFDVSGSQRAATSALIRLADRRDGVSLLAASDRRPTKSASALEMLSGDGAAAAILGIGDPIAVLLGAHSTSADLVDHYRTSETGADYSLEDRWFRDEGVVKLAAATIPPLLERAGLSPKDLDHIIVPVPNSAMARAAVKAIGARPETLADGLQGACGHTGAAHPLLLLAHTLETAAPGAKILIAAFGQGCDAILLDVREAARDLQRRRVVSGQLEARRVQENYPRFLVANGSLDVDWGMRAERDNRTAQSVAYSKSRDIYGFVGGRCRVCGTPQFPKSRRCVNPDCGALDSQDDYRFADEPARVKSFTEDWMAFTREPPLLYGNVSFEGGGNAFIEMCGFGPGEIKIGSPLRMAFRIKDIDAQRGFHRYFWKGAPAWETADG